MREIQMLLIVSLPVSRRAHQSLPDRLLPTTCGLRRCFTFALVVVITSCAVLIDRFCPLFNLPPLCSLFACWL